MRWLIVTSLLALQLMSQTKKYEIQQPKGTWQKPGEIQKPTGPWLVPKEIQGVRAQELPCEARMILSADTLFAFDKSELTAQSEGTLLAIGPIVKEKAGAHPVNVEGHTDSLGQDAYNQTLSERRARTVQEWLVARGYLLKEKTRTEGLGKRRPVAANSTPDGKDNPDGRQKNRRVEIAINTCK